MISFELDTHLFAEPTLATEFVQKLFACQHNEKVFPVRLDHILELTLVVAVLDSRLRRVAGGDMSVLTSRERAEV